jgi:hypothetical protein
MGVIVSVIPAQRLQMNTWRIACSSATSADRDHAISMLQDWQMGAANRAIDRLSISMERRFPLGIVPPQECTVNVRIDPARLADEHRRHARRADIQPACL